MPAYLLYGDSFLVAEALKELQQQVGPSEVLDANRHLLVANEVGLAQVKAVCDAVPFLAEKRLVIVEGLFSLLEARRRGSGRAVSQPKSTTTPSGWEGLESYLPVLPPSTLLVFVDGRLSPGNSLLKRLRALLQVRDYPALIGETLARWLRNQVSIKGGEITPGAIALLSKRVGGNLWALDTELDKLTLYCSDRPIEEADVRLLVSQVREASIFAAIDALLEGRIGVALPLVHRLREEGAEFSYIVSMIARQLRLVVLARERLEQGLGSAEIGKRLNIRPDFVLRKTLAQAKRHPQRSLIELYQRLLESDLAVKRGALNEEVALDLLVGSISAP